MHLEQIDVDAQIIAHASTTKREASVVLYVQLKSLWVRNRNNGVGSGLMTELELWAREQVRINCPKASSIVIEADVSSPFRETIVIRRNAFYERHGYEESYDGDDLVAFIKTIPLGDDLKSETNSL